MDIIFQIICQLISIPLLFVFILAALASMTGGKSEYVWKHALHLALKVTFVVMRHILRGMASVINYSWQSFQNHKHNQKIQTKINVQPNWVERN